jgi:uncharacterized protein YycO
MDSTSFVIIGQYYGQSWMSKFIKWRTWSPISHTAALSRDEKYVFEAWRKGVQKTAWQNSHHKPGTKVDLYKVSCSEEEANRFYNYLESQTGRKYDFKAIIGFVLRLPMARLNALFCSEYIFTAALTMPKNLLERVEPYQVSPGHLNLSPLMKFYKTVYTP